MRFDAPEHVLAWQKHRQFPKIHDLITSFVREQVGAGDGTVLDLCSSTGLLGRRLSTHGYRVVAAQEPAPGLDIGMTSGVYEGIPVFTHRIVADTVDEFVAWMRERQVRTIVARRCISELFTSLGADGLLELSRRWRDDVGVTAVVLQGRAPTLAATHPVPNTAAEIRVLGSVWRTVELRDPVVILGPASR